MMTREEAVMWGHMRATFTITNIVPLYYQGSFAGSEFLTYVNTKIYLCLCINPNSTGTTSPAAYIVTFYDAANAAFDYMSNQSITFDPVAAQNEQTGLSLCRKLLWFSRLTASTYLTMRFLGYRLTITP